MIDPALAARLPKALARFEIEADEAARAVAPPRSEADVEMALAREAAVQDTRRRARRTGNDRANAGRRLRPLHRVGRRRPGRAAARPGAPALSRCRRGTSGRAARGHLAPRHRGRIGS